jgi:hypothetical protein
VTIPTPANLLEWFTSLTGKAVAADHGAAQEVADEAIRRTARRAA